MPFMQRLRLLHPILFLIISLLSTYTGARLIANPFQLIRPMIILCGLLGILYPICFRLTNNRDWAGVLLSILVLGFCYTRSAFFSVGLFSIVLVLIVIMIFRLLKKKVGIQQISAFLTILGTGVVFMQTLSLGIIFSTIPSTYFRDMAVRSREKAIPLSPGSAGRPDIYYIILDGYPRADVLKEIYGYDNSAWINELMDSGFIVPEHSHSNYPRTAISVSTTLDMQYWESISPGMESAVYWWLVEPVIDHSRLRSSLESIGYSYVTIATDWGITNNPHGSTYLKPYPVILNDFENYYLSATPLKLLYAPLQGFAPIVNNDIHRDITSFNIESLKTAVSLPGPKFVFSHIIVPHPPFVFDAEGNPIDSDVSFTFDSPDSSIFSKAEYKTRYIDQVKFINNEMRKVIKALLEDSVNPPIIVIQADHGSALYVDFNDLPGSCMKERFSNFAAYYLPGALPDVIPQDISAVNIFRIVLDEYFNAHLGILENHQYFMDGFYLFDNQDVTDRVDDSCVIRE